MYIIVIRKNHECIYIPVDSYFTPAKRFWKILKMTLKSAWKVLEFDLEKCVRTLFIGAHKSYDLITMHPAKRSVEKYEKWYWICLYMLARSRSSRQQAVELVPCFYQQRKAAALRRIVFYPVFWADLCLLHTLTQDVSQTSPYLPSMSWDCAPRYPPPLPAML